jgi:hypothetical protein
MTARPLLSQGTQLAPADCAIRALEEYSALRCAADSIEPMPDPGLTQIVKGTSFRRLASERHRIRAERATA